MVEKLIDFIKSIRNLRSELDIPVSQKLTIYIETKDTDFFSKHSDDIKSLVRVNKLIIDKNINKPKSSVSTVGGDCKIYLLMEHGDVEAQINLIKKKIEKLESENSRMAKRLNNENFIKKAPWEAVEETKERLEKSEKDLNKLKEILNDLENS
jgi:valyl-tRNA synthetase